MANALQLEFLVVVPGQVEGLVEAIDFPEIDTKRERLALTQEVVVAEVKTMRAMQRF